MHRWLGWLAAALLALGMPALARDVTALDGPWRFQRGDIAGAEAASFDDGAWPSVALPHTFNAVDGEAGGAFYRGPAWYRTTVESPTTAAGRRSFLEFDGAALAADVWVNGRHAGRHEGGYARFRFDVSALLKPGRNVLAVRVDNAGNPAIAPLGGDFTVFGGLYRRVRLVQTGVQHLELLDHGGPGIGIAIDDVSAASARLTITAAVRNDGAQREALNLRLTLRDAAGRPVLRQQQPLSVAAGSAQPGRTTLTLPRPHLWQGVEDPYLYRLTAEVLRRGAVVDALTVPVGIRAVALDPQRGMLLNGKPYALHGVNYFHPGRPGRGLAVGDAEIDEDLRILQQLGVTGLRLVHFQHPARVYERADELGFVLWTEIPLNAALTDSAAFRANLAQQLRELMRQNGHHASVAIWGMGNEVYQVDATSRALLGDLHAQAKREDPRRPTAYAHCCAADDDPLALQTDLTGYNRYFGWYDGEMADLGPWADALHARLPTRTFGISEYGAGASALQQQSPPQRPRPNGRWHPEQYQALFHESYWRQIAARPWLAGNFVWVGFDLASAGRDEGDRPGVNDKGLVSYDRRLTKDAYHLYRAHWSREPTVHITSRRLTPRPAGPTAVKVYTNAARVTLTLNGKPLGSVAAAERIATWPAVPLAPGRNELRAAADNGAVDTVVWEATPPEGIAVNQVGFPPKAAKWAAVPDTAAAEFTIVDARNGAVAHRGRLGAAAVWEPAQAAVRLADFSALTTPGTYRVHVEGLADSPPFDIAADAYQALNAAAIKAFTLNRAGIALPRHVAGAWARPAGHADVPVRVHASAASATRPEGTLISSPKGWYDAGDYNQYVVNSGITVYTLLAAWEHFPAHFQRQRLAIPESGNGLPDLLNETLWNLDWLLTMQDPADGGVYHKLTNKGFDGMVMPHEARNERWVVQKSTAATLDFAAVMAQASRVFAPFEAQRPGLSARMLAAAKAAWRWAQANPAVVYRQPPDIRTGGYGDDKLADEFAWAAAELYATTRDDGYLRALQPERQPTGVPSWGDVGPLAWVTLAHHRERLTAAADRQLIESRIVGLADELAATWQASPYRLSMQARDFIWGSNAVALNQALMLIQGYRLSGRRAHLDAAQALLDDVLGRNPLGLSMVTGFGSRYPLHPHHRPSDADGVAAPVPGFIVGGPNPGQQDAKDCPVPYASKAPALSYLDHVCSYAANEVAINWNAPLVYVSAALQELTPP